MSALTEHRATEPTDPATLRAPQVLIIEDEAMIVEFLRVGLTYEGYRVSVARDGQTGMRLAGSGDADLVILDLMLPDLDGFEVCRWLRRRCPELPLIILTARTEIPDRVTGLDLGADDYLTKPFSFAELLARIRSVSRRRGPTVEPAVLRGAGIVLDPEAREATKDGKPIELTPTEFLLLELFLRHPRRAFSRETLRHRIWGIEGPVDTNVVDVHIAHLRTKLGDQERRLIRTVYGVGYRFDLDEHAPLVA